MNTRLIGYLISISAIVLIVIHLVFPKLTIDGITLGLVLLAVIPWLAPLFKSVQFPGGWKVEFQEFLRAEQKADSVGLLAPVEPDIRAEEYSYQLLQKSDPNLALAGLRLEIETRLRQIAEGHDIPIKDQSVFQVVESLVKTEIFQRNEGRVIQDLLNLLNSAVHGAQVDSMTIGWVSEIGPRILRALDKRRL